MMRIWYTVLFCFIVIQASAGKSYTLAATRGDLVIGNTITDPALRPGDTLYIPSNGRYTSVQYRHLKGDSAHKVWVIWLPGSRVTSPLFFQQLSSYNVSYAGIEGMRHYNFYGTQKFSYGVHDVIFQQCQWIDPSCAKQTTACVTVTILIHR